MIFDFKAKTTEMQTYYAVNGTPYNNAQEYGVTVKFHAPLLSFSHLAWRCLGVYHLSGSENVGKHHVFCDVLDEGGARVNRARLVMRQKQGGDRVVYAVVDKPHYEPGTNFPMWGNTPSSVKVDDAYEPRCDEVLGLHPVHPDEEEGNTIGHHSFFIVFQLLPSKKEESPPIDPDPGPPTGRTHIKIQVTVNREYVLELPVDDDGNVLIEVRSQI